MSKNKKVILLRWSSRHPAYWFSAIVLTFGSVLAIIENFPDVFTLVIGLILIIFGVLLFSLIKDNASEWLEIRNEDLRWGIEGKSIGKQTLHRVPKGDIASVRIYPEFETPFVRLVLLDGTREKIKNLAWLSRGTKRLEKNLRLYGYPCIMITETNSEIAMDKKMEQFNS